MSFTSLHPITSRCGIILLLLIQTASAQPRYNAALLDTLQQIEQTRTTARHFATLYHKAIEITNGYAHSQPGSVKNFIFGFESSFGPLFFASYKNYCLRQPQSFSWQPYYRDSTLNPLQYMFIGMNAHINGDMWLALKNAYVYDTLYKYKNDLIRFQKVYNVFFDSIYSTTRQYKKVRRLHRLTLGLDKALGRRMVLRWRKRQVALALLYYRHPAQCNRRWQRVQRKMQRFNRFALHWLR
jgi:hypothetical protein